MDVCLLEIQEKSIIRDSSRDCARTGLSAQAVGFNMMIRKVLLARTFLLLNVPTNALTSLTMSTSLKHTLYDMPVSNNGARCRIIVYKKQIPENEVSIQSPMVLGGLKTPEYLALNPQGKMPLLTCADGMNIPESDTICRYLMSEYKELGPSFQPENAKSNLIARLHDMYLTTIQGCLYKAGPPFGIYGTRSDAIAEYRKQLQVIDEAIGDNIDGIYLCGTDVSLADATLFPSMTFAKFMLPLFGVPEDEALPPRIASWYQKVIDFDADFAKVHNEVHDALQKWKDNGRWDTIWLAGVRDEEPTTLFDKIISGDIPAAVVKEDSNLLAFKDINPAAPAHVIVIPKDRMGLSQLTEGTPEHTEILGRLLVAAAEIAKDESLGFKDGARFVINNGKDGGQEVSHLHVHVLGGREMAWPPE